MTEVRIRHDMDANSASLGDVPFKDIDAIIPLLKKWGIRVPGYTDGYADDGAVLGEFVYDGEREEAYFEVVIHDD